MGTITVSQKNHKTHSLADPPKMEINLDIDIDKTIPTHLCQLTNWSFQEIRQAFKTFQRISQSPMIDSFLFHKILPFSKKNCDIMFVTLSKGAKYFSVYELMGILILTSYQTARKKFQFFLLIFDFLHKGHITGKQFMLIYESVAYGFCRLTGQPLQKFSKLQKFGISSFFAGEDDYQLKDINIYKFMVEYEANQKIYELFQRFQQNQLKEIKEDFNVYHISNFKKFSPQDVVKIYRILLKAYEKNDFEQIHIIQQNKEMRRKNRRDQCLRQIIQQKSIIANPSLLRSIQSKPSIPKLQKYNSQSLSKLKTIPVSESKPSLTQRHSSTFRLRKQQSSINSSSHKQKLIFLKGKTYSKKDIFDTITYFKNISDNQEKVGIKDFFRRFEKKTFMKKQLSSIFKLLDYENKGQITLQGFFRALYPGITNSDVQLLLNWYGNYQQIYESDKLARNLNKPVIMNETRVLPPDTLERMKQIFRVMDIGEKGFLNFQDLRKAYKAGFTADELQKLLKDFGEDNKIYLKGICKMLLPYGWQIQGVNIQQL